MSGLRLAPAAGLATLPLALLETEGVTLVFTDDAVEAMAARRAAEAALNKNAVTFATLDMKDLLGANGFLAKLKAKGYTVLAPDE